MLTETVFRSDDLPREDRFDAWRECASRTMAPMEITSAHAADFMAHQRLLRLDTLSVWPVTAHAGRYRRTPKLIRRSDPELYHLTLVMPGSGPLDVTYVRREIVHRPYDLYLLDLSRPCDVDSGDERSPVRAIGVEIPKVLLPLAGSRGLDGLLGRRMPGDRGFGALLAQFLTRLSTESSPYRPSDAPRLNTVLVDLLSGLVAHELDAERALPAETRERNLVVRVRSHIHRHLHDPELTPRTIAAAHHLSVRQLHRLFEDENVTVAGLIRDLRLERARRDLADPDLRDTPVHAVAARSGFTAPAHFSRAFRAAYGTSPSEFRRLARHGGDGARRQHPVTGHQRQAGPAAEGSVAEEPTAA
ncbi:helix-turn-helix domain-containing protein [Streptomyces sp. NPDC047928]|uniref:helix-turn-helix domain-containing protein n=1 Tax=unclassified Streptomyces TaxID=2593676 RepID=UPI0037170E05